MPCGTVFCWGLLDGLVGLAASGVRSGGFAPTAPAYQLALEGEGEEVDAVAKEDGEHDADQRLRGMGLVAW